MLFGWLEVGSISFRVLTSMRDYIRLGVRDESDEEG